MSDPGPGPIIDAAIVAYDLPIPTRSPFHATPCPGCGKERSPYTPLRNLFGRGHSAPDPHAACYAKMTADREARVAAELATAVADWEQVRQQHHDKPIVLAVLDLHQPEDADNAHYYVGCRECCEPDGMENVQPEHWPCGTYTVIRAGEEPEASENPRLPADVAEAIGAVLADQVRIHAADLKEKLGRPSVFRNGIRNAEIPRSFTGCHQASFGWVHVKPDCRCGHAAN